MGNAEKLDIGFVNYAKEKAYLEHCKQIAEFQEQLQSIIDHSFTVEKDIRENKKVYNYITGLFPNVTFDGLKVYEVSRKQLRGLGALGVYIHGQKVILYTRTSSSSDLNLSHKKYKRFRVSSDEVLVHELLHYCDHYFFPEAFDANNNYNDEEFAMGYSLGFFRQQQPGISDEDIVIKKYYAFLDSNFRKVVMETALMINDISVEEFYKWSDKKKYRTLLKHKRTIDKLKYDLYVRIGNDLIIRYDKAIEDLEGANKHGGISGNKVNEFDLLRF